VRAPGRSSPPRAGRWPCSHTVWRFRSVRRCEGQATPALRSGAHHPRLYLDRRTRWTDCSASAACARGSMSMPARN
jgi:hypothetical protein